VLGDLAALGYGTQWDVISAVDLGAKHRRERLWIVAHVNRDVLEAFNARGMAGEDSLPGRGGTLQQLIKLWPTPTATLGTKGGRVTPRKGRNGGTLIEAMACSPANTGWRAMRC